MPDQTVSIAFAAGIETRTDPKYVQPGTLLACLNGVFDKTGAIRKRHGCTALPTVVFPSLQAGTLLGPSALPPAPAARFAYGQEDCHLAGTLLYGLTDGGLTQTERGYWGEAVGSYTPLSQGATAQSSADPDCVTIGGYVVYAWVNNAAAPGLGAGEVYAAVYDANGTLALATPKGFTGNTHSRTPKLVALGNTAVLVWADSTANELWASTLTLTGTNFQWSAPVAILAMSTASPVFDVYAVSATAFVVGILGYSNGFILALYNSSLVQTLAQDIAVTGMTNAVAIGVYATTGEQGVFAISYVDGSGFFTLATYGFSPSALTTTWVVVNFVVHSSTSTDLPLQLGLSRYSSTQTLLVWQDSNNNAGLAGFPQFGKVTIGRTILNSAGDSTGRRRSSGLQLLSRPFVGPTGRSYVLVGLGSAVQGTVYLVDLLPDTSLFDGDQISPLRPVATLLPRQALVPSSYSTRASMRDPGSLCHVCPATIATQWLAPANALAGDVPAGALQLVQLRLDWAHPGRGANALAGQVQTIGGGTPSSYDGVSVSELVFTHFAELANETPTQATGGAMVPGTIGAPMSYSYFVVYEWSDAKGNFYQSSPGTPVTIALTGSNSAVNLPVPLPMLSTKPLSGAATPIAAVVYRTQANGTVYYRVFTGGYVPAALLGNGTGGVVTYLDTAADTTIASHPILYTTGGVLQNLCPPSFAHTWTHRGRIWGIGDDLFTVWASQSFTVGLSPGFNDNVTMTIGDGQALTAGASMDEKCLIFTADQVYFVIGDGPNDEGASNDWTVPQKVPGDVGCVDPRSLALIPDGLVFMSKRGLCLLTRGLQVVYLSAPEDVVTGFPTVTAAVVVPEHQEVRFALNNGTNGINLVLNYFEPPAPGQYKWSVFQHYDATAAASSAIVSAAAYVAGAYRWTSVAGNPYVEDTSGAAYTDGGSSAANWVTFSITTAWVAAAGIEGLQRVKRVALNADRYTSHNVTIAIATDYNPSTKLPTGWAATWTSDIVDAAATPEELRLVVPRQKCHALQVVVTDAFPTGSEAVVGTGRGMSLSGLALRVAVKDGVGNRIPAAQRG